MANPEWTDVYDEIRDERQRQDAKHGGAEHDDAHSYNDFIAFIAKHSGRCVDAKPHEVRRHMLRVAALAVAVIEKKDRSFKSELQKTREAAALTGGPLVGSPEGRPK
jgi:hypothetical protein